MFGDIFFLQLFSFLRARSNLNFLNRILSGTISSLIINKKSCPSGQPLIPANNINFNLYSYQPVAEYLLPPNAPEEPAVNPTELLFPLVPEYSAATFVAFIMAWEE